MMARNARIIEGPLSKWTNVVNGWQYRWFVLDQTSGLLSYYTVSPVCSACGSVGVILLYDTSFAFAISKGSIVEYASTGGGPLISLATSIPPFYVAY